MENRKRHICFKCGRKKYEKDMKPYESMHGRYYAGTGFAWVCLDCESDRRYGLIPKHEE
jgi:hypothetical protein